MIDSEANKVLATTGIYADTLEKIAREAARLKKQSPLERKPSAAKVIERAIDTYLSSIGNTPVPVPPQPEDKGELKDKGDNIHQLESALNEPEQGFLRECLTIYRSAFGDALRENVKWFRIGMNAVAKLEALGGAGERGSSSDPQAASAAEQRADALLDISENEADLLKKAALEPPEELRRNRSADPKTADRPKPRRKSGK